MGFVHLTCNLITKYPYIIETKNMNIEKMLANTEKLQSEIHKMTVAIQKDPHCKNLSYDSIKDVVFMMEIANLKEEIEILKTKIL
jgi:hypothetical protein